MCGLVGAFRTQESWWDAQKIKQFTYMGLHLASFRGTQGTGVGLVADDGEVSVNKSHLAAVDFLRTEMWDWVEAQLAQSHVIMGHTRFPTFANTVHSKNAQPFWYGSEDAERQVMLTHNGHINSHHDLTKGIKGFFHPVDSAHVAKAMAEAKHPKDLLPTMRGNFALVWYDEKERRMFATNNGGRELWMASSKDGKQMYYCSERGMLKFLLDRTGIEVKNIEEVPENECYSWNLDAKELMPGKYFKYKEKPYVVEATYGSGRDWHGGGGGQSTSKKGTIVWASMSPGTDFIRYPALKDGRLSEFGKIMCTIPATRQSVCIIDGVREATWNDCLKPFFLKNGNTFPCRVANFEMEDGPDGTKYPLFTVGIEMDQFNRELTRLKNLSHVGTTPIAIMGPNPASPIFVPGPGKSKITRDAWDETSKEGCFYCQSAIFRCDEGKVGFQLIRTSIAGEDLYQHVCPSCVSKIKAGELAEVLDKAL